MAPTADIDLLPSRTLFDPLIADPRTPHFSAGRVSHQGDREGHKSLASTVAGGYFGVVEWGEPGRRWQFGAEYGVFAIWDMGTESYDLRNIDFLVGLPVTWRRGRWSGMARLYHISTHLGDEYLLHNPVTRQNLAFEALDLKLSYDLGRGLRLYGGGGRMVRSFPADRRPWMAQAGAEYLGPGAFVKGLFRPVAAADLEKRQELGWGPTALSVRAGVELEGPRGTGRRCQLLLEFYRGRDPNGQFDVESIRELGAGVHFYF